MKPPRLPDIEYNQYPTGWKWTLICPCGWRTDSWATLEAAGRDLDIHMAKMFPIGTERRPCDPKPTMTHGVPFEYDPTPLKRGEHHVVARSAEVPK